MTTHGHEATGDETQDERPRMPRALRMLGAIPRHAGAATCFGEAVRSGDRAVVPVAEVQYAFGFGWGGGRSSTPGGQPQGGRGGGAGGAARSRAIAAIEIGPDGVRVHSVMDQTAIVLASIAVASALIGLAFKLRRR